MQQSFIFLYISKWSVIANQTSKVKKVKKKLI